MAWQAPACTRLAMAGSGTRTGMQEGGQCAQLGCLTSFAHATPACHAGPYSTYEGSPVSKGILQPDMWGVKPSDRWDWDGLRRDIAQVGPKLVQRAHTASAFCLLAFAVLLHAVCWAL